MYRLIKKIRSAAYLLASDPQPLKAIANRWRASWRQYQVQSRKGNNFIYKTKLGFKFVCLPESKTSVNLYINNFNYEEIELQIAWHWLQTRDNCLDLGANIGYFSALMAQKVSASGKAIAIEPAPQTAAYLTAAAKILSLPQICLELACITDRDGEVEFMTSSNGSADVKQALQVNPAEANLFKKELVKSITVNSAIAKHQIQSNISLVKMDIEGAEPLALKGASLLFEPEALPLFIVEIYKLGLSRLNFTPADVWQFFPADLFELYHINRSYPNPMPEFEYGTIYPLNDPQNRPWPWHTNIIAIPKVGKYASRKMLIQSYLPSVRL